MGNCQNHENTTRDVPTLLRESSKLLDINGMTSIPYRMPLTGAGNEASTDNTATATATPIDLKIPVLPIANIHMSPIEIDESYISPKFKKSVRDVKFIRQAIEGNFIFDHIGKKECVRLLDAFQLYSVTKGEEIIAEGDFGDFFYIIQSGKGRFTINGEKLGSAGAGKSFGDLAMLYNCHRSATCTANSSRCNLWRVDQKTFRQILANSRITDDQNTINALKSVPMLKDLLSDKYLTKMVAMAMNRKFREGDCIIQKGDLGDHFFIIKTGSVLVKNIEAGGQERFTEKILKAGEFFGERALVTNERRSADITALEDCSTLCLSRQDFLKKVGPFDKLLQNDSDQQDLVSFDYTNESSCLLPLYCEFQTFSLASKRG